MIWHEVTAMEGTDSREQFPSKVERYILKPGNQPLCLFIYAFEA